MAAIEGDIMGIFDLFCKYRCQFWRDLSTVDFGSVSKTRHRLNNLRGADGYCVLPKGLMGHTEAGPLDCYKSGKRFGCKIYNFHGKTYLKVKKMVENRE